MRLKNLKNSLFILSAVFCLLCSVLIFTGCATTEDVNRTQYDTNLLKTEVRDIKEKLSSPLQKEKLVTLDKKLQEIQSTQELTSKSVSDLLIQFQSLTTEFRVLTGRFEESRYYAEKVSTEMKSEKEKLAAQLKELELSIDDLKKRVALAEKIASPDLKEEANPAEEKKTVEEAKTVEETKKAQESEKKGLEKPEDKKEAQKTERKKEITKTDVKDVYLTGYQAFKEGKTAEARENFMSVLKDYPDNEYSDNARFWMAESYYKEKNYEDAILVYEELLKKNPKSDKASGALWKQGLSFYALKDEKTGKIVLEKLIEQFPNSEQALLAKKKLGKTPPSKKK
ncbi:MAG: tol-pal system protein YbgF [Nitrospirae bacterium]|nr:tol-pal system protein YbgF [Nitrospirota bacterium]